MRGLKLRPGSSLEVNIDIDRKGEVWYPASFVEQVNPNSCLVKLVKSKKGGNQKVVVDFSHIRPPPTHGYRKSFSVNDKVDALHDNGWWTGVVSHVLEGRRCLVRLDRTQEEKELRLADLRLHMEWSNSNGEWFQSPPADDEKQRIPRSKGKPQRKHALVSALAQEQNGKESPSQSANSGQNLKEESKKGVKRKQQEASKDQDSQNNGIYQRRKSGRPCRFATEVNTPKTKEADVGDDSTNNKMKALDNLGVQDVEPVGAGTTSNDVNDSDGCSSGIPPPPPTAEHCEEETGEREGHNKEQLDNPTKDSSQEKKHDRKAPSTEVSGENDTQERPKNNLALSTVTAPLDFEVPPFLKSSQVWNMIESMEIFKQLPQKPHFRPLHNCNEESREGLAIGNMVAFASLVDRVPRLKFHDPTTLIDGYIEALNELESMGLEVGPVRDKLTKLLTIKNREETTLNTVKQIEGQVLEREREKLKLTEEISEVDGKIRKLNMKKGSLVSRREMKDGEIVLLESSKDGVKGSLKKMEEEFEAVVASFR